MDQLDRRARVPCHPVVAPRDHRDEQRIEINALLGKSILESARSLLVFDPAQDAIAHQLAKPIEYQNRPRRFEYRLTQKGIDLYPLLVAMITWGDHWMAGHAGTPVELVHRRCGHAINPKLTCPSCSETIVPREMSARPGPALRKRGLPGQRTHAA